MVVHSIILCIFLWLAKFLGDSAPTSHQTNGMQSVCITTLQIASSLAAKSHFSPWTNMEYATVTDTQSYQYAALKANEIIMGNKAKNSALASNSEAVRIIAAVFVSSDEVVNRERFVVRSTLLQRVTDTLTKTRRLLHGIKSSTHDFQDPQFARLELGRSSTAFPDSD